MNVPVFRIATVYLILGGLFLLPGCGKTPSQLRKERLVESRIAPEATESLDYGLLKKNPKTMTLVELQQAKTLAWQEDNKPLVITYLEQIIAKTTNQGELKAARLELADAAFDNGDLDKAFAYYTQFSLQYPGSEERKEADYKAILSRFYVMLSYDRDQSKTREALELAQAYLAKAEVYQKYSKEVQDIKEKCLQRLFEAEKYVFEHHMRSGNILGAKNRITYMRKQFDDIFSQVEPQIIALECTVAQVEGNDELLDAKKVELTKKYPDFAQTYLASLKRKKLTDYVMRF